MTVTTSIKTLAFASLLALAPAQMMAALNFLWKK
jgi:hypothetical protein